MGAYIKPIRNLVSKTADKGFELLDKKLVELEANREKFIQELNYKSAIKYANELGLTPVHNLDILKKSLNERIIVEVKGRKLRHRDVAAITQSHRSRITAIMNRRLERVTIDCMIQILNMLGIPTTIHF